MAMTRESYGMGIVSRLMTIIFSTFESLFNPPILIVSLTVSAVFPNLADSPFHSGSCCTMVQNKRKLGHEY